MKNLSCLFLIGVLSVLIFTNSSFSQSGYSDNLGNFLRFGGGARAMAMAGAYTALSDEGTAVFWNPAGLSQIDRLHLQFMYNNLFLQGASYSFFSTAYPVYHFPGSDSKTTVGFGWAGMNSGSFKRRDVGGNPIGTFSESRNAFFFPVAYDYINDVGRFSFGARYIYFTHNFADYSAGGSEFDVGFLGHFINPPQWTILGLLPIAKLIPWRFGLLFRFPGSEQLKDFRENFPNSMHAGISYTAPQLPGIPGRLVFAYEFNKIFGDYKNSAASFLGSEYQYSFGEGKYTGSLRGGFKPNAGENELRYSIGLGGAVRFEKFQVSFDYALSSHPVLKDNSTFFVTLQFLPQKNNVANLKKETDLTSMSKSDLLRTLLKYPIDQNMIDTGKNFRERIESLYKDGENDTLINSGVAEELIRRYEKKDTTNNEDVNVPVKGGSNGTAKLTQTVSIGKAPKSKDQRIINRLDSFSGGLKKLIKRYNGLLSNTKPGKGYKYSYLNYDKKDYHQLFLYLAHDFSKREKKLSKNSYTNILALNMYLHTLLIVGDTANCERVVKERLAKNKGVSAGTRTYYSFLRRAHDSRDVNNINLSNSLKKSIGNSANPEFVKLYLKFLLAINDSSYMSELVNDSTAKKFMPKSLLPAPFMQDGFIYDDVELIDNCNHILMSSSSEITVAESQNELLSIAYKYPFTSAANIIIKYLQDIRNCASYSDLENLCQSILDSYKKWATFEI